MNQMETFVKRMQEDLSAILHPDLVPFLEQDGALGPQLRHPLVYQVPFFSNGSANAFYEQKIKALEEALKKKDYTQFVYLYERPYRLEIFKQVTNNLTDTQYWSLLSSIWVDTENQWQNLEQWKKLLSANRPNRHYLMDESEVQLLNSLPEFVKIYRGCQKGLNENGLSWTLKESKAKFFAKRFSKEGIVLEREIPKSDIIAVLTGRGESEVIWEVKK